MNTSLKEHLSKLDKHQTRNAYMLHGDIDMRACCKSLRERLKRLLPTVDHHVVWLRVEGGVLLFVAGPYIIARVLSDFCQSYAGFTEYNKLYDGQGRKVIRELVQDALAAGYETVGQRSFGASRP
jgi:hypothetical protein